MRQPLVRALPLVALVALVSTPRAQEAAAGATHAILITLDGARAEDIFGGLDLAVLRSTLDADEAVEDTAVYKAYWAPTPEERRRRLMPFFWDTWMREHGSVAGNRARGSTMTLANGHRFSYPGYAEILTGQPHDAVIDSNDNRQNPFPTVLEFVRRALDLPRERVAVFGSWETFRYIAESEPGAIATNAGYQAYPHDDPVVRRTSALQFEARSPWDTVRNDAFTFRLAMAHLATARPRVLYLALGETDDWAHDGRYDRVLQTLALTDGYLRELWTWLQADPEYRDRTAILITVDHGRGPSPDDWRKHGKDVEGARYTWLAAIGPGWPRRGEWRDAPPISTSQVAATLARALGLDYAGETPGAGRAIDALW